MSDTIEPMILNLQDNKSALVSMTSGGSMGGSSGGVGGGSGGQGGGRETHNAFQQLALTLFEQNKALQRDKTQVEEGVGGRALENRELGEDRETKRRRRGS